MLTHWYEYLPAAWFTPEGRWYVTISVLLLMLIAFVAGYFVGKNPRLFKPKKHGCTDY